MSDWWNIVQTGIIVVICIVLRPSIVYAGTACRRSMPKKIPKNSALFSKETTSTYFKDRGEIRYICGFLQGVNGILGKDFIINDCINGHWTYDDSRMPECKNTVTWCKGASTFEYRGNCYFYFLSPRLQDTQFWCKVALEARPVVIDDEDEFDAIGKGLSGPSGIRRLMMLGKPALIWMPLTRENKERTEWKWTTNPATDDWKSWWKSDRPKRESTDVAGLSYPDMWLTNPTETELNDTYQTIGGANTFGMCKLSIDQFSRRHDFGTGYSRLHLLYYDEEFNVELTNYSDGLFDFITQTAPEKNRNIFFLLGNRSCESGLQYWALGDIIHTDLPFRSKIFQHFYTERIVTKLMATPVFDMNKSGLSRKGIRCGLMHGDDSKKGKRRTGNMMQVEVNMSDNFYVKMTLSKIFPKRICRAKDHGSEQFPEYGRTRDKTYFKLPISMKASNKHTGAWAITDWFTGLDQMIYTYVIGITGWSQWTHWVHCTINMNESRAITSRHRICGYMFEPSKFKFDVCKGVRVEFQKTFCTLDKPPPPPTSKPVFEMTFDTITDIQRYGDLHKAKPTKDRGLIIAQAEQRDLSFLWTVYRAFTYSSSSIPCSQLHMLTIMTISLAFIIIS